MKLSSGEIDLIAKSGIVMLATSSLDSSPRVIIVEVNKVEKDKIIVTDNQMQIIKNNLLENKKVFVLVYKNGCGLKISGMAEYYTDGDYFNFVKNLDTNKEFSPKGVVVINIENIEEFE